MAIFLDADVIIRGEKGRFALTEWLTARSTDQFTIAAITVAELWHGVERAERPQRASRERYLKSIVSKLPIVPYTEQIAYIHAQLWAQLQQQGRMIGYYDLIVAATALEQSGQVATFNVRHFGAVPGLQIIEPSI